MNAVRGWMIGAAIVCVAVGARAQGDAGGDATDGAPPGTESGAPSCNLSTGYEGDEQCILPPVNGFQLHYGPATYDQAAAPYVIPPGTENVACVFSKTPNTAVVFANEFLFSARPGLYDASFWRLPAARPDSTEPEPCGALDAAPENGGLAWSIEPHTQIAMKLHAIDVRAQPILTEAWLNVIATDASAVTKELAPLDLRGVDGDVPPAIQLVDSFSCPAPGEIRVIELTALDRKSTRLN